MRRRANPAGSPHHFIGLVALWTCVVHAFFVAEVLFALRLGGFVDSDWAMAVFFPHFILVASLPPKYPLDEKVIHVWKLIAKLLDALPASLLYGIIIALVWNSLYRVLTRVREPAR